MNAFVILQMDDRRLSSNSVVGPRMVVSFGVERPDGFLNGAIEVFRSREDPMVAIGRAPALWLGGGIEKGL